ncbi:MAG: hypothetical protein GY828_06755, partial [Candidatus Gracilibacteria bacterium]|nr:hypothetical protein [Candidatus Gracilibacteria bacterium]
MKEGKEEVQNVNIENPKIHKSEACVDLSQEILNQVQKKLQPTIEKEQFSYRQYLGGLSVERLVELFFKPSDTYGKHEQYSINKHRELLSEVLFGRLELMLKENITLNEKEKQVYERIISEKGEVLDKGESEEIQRIIKSYIKGSMRLGQSKSFFENHLEKLD